MRRPSQHTIDLYNQLVKKQNAVRKILKKIHKRAEETLGVGRLPALIVPKKARTVRNSNNMNIRLFWQRYRNMRDLFAKGVDSYLGKVVKAGYLQIWRDQIDIIPEGYFGTYSALQIREAGELGRFMEVYNKLTRLSGLAFLALQYTNNITAFKWIYEDFKAYREGRFNRVNSYLEEQLEALERVGSSKAIMQMFRESIGLKDPINRRQKDIDKALLLQRRD